MNFGADEFLTIFENRMHLITTYDFCFHLYKNFGSTYIVIIQMEESRMICFPPFPFLYLSAMP